MNFLEGRGGRSNYFGYAEIAELYETVKYISFLYDLCTFIVYTHTFINYCDGV